MKRISIILIAIVIIVAAALALRQRAQNNTADLAQNAPRSLPAVEADRLQFLTVGRHQTPRGAQVAARLH